MVKNRKIYILLILTILIEVALVNMRTRYVNQTENYYAAMHAMERANPSLSVLMAQNPGYVYIKRGVNPQTNEPVFEPRKATAEDYLPNELAPKPATAGTAKMIIAELTLQELKRYSKGE